MRNFDKVHLAGFSCFVCFHHKADCDGYERSKILQEGELWRPCDRTMKCTKCGYDAPDIISQKKFHNFIKWRDSLPNGGALNPENRHVIGERLKNMKSLKP